MVNNLKLENIFKCKTLRFSVKLFLSKSNTYVALKSHWTMLTYAYCSSLHYLRYSYTGPYSPAAKRQYIVDLLDLELM
jgi:hypothetical protein